MTGSHRVRWLSLAALTTVLASGLIACSGYPNTTFGAHSEFGHAEDHLTYLLLILGGIVFVMVEGLLLFILFKFRARPGNPQPKQTHGNTTLEVTWTLIPAIILAIIAVPTVRTIFQTQAKAAPNALQVEVIGHQWWWEFHYPQYNVTTANELYLPVGRTVNFSLRTNDVIHSFWAPQLGGKRDVVHRDKPNYLWYTPESSYVWNGFCAEYCGTSHSNMRFRVFTVPPQQFAEWIKHQQTGPAFPAASATPAPADTSKQAKTPAAAAPTPVAPAIAVAEENTGTWPVDKLPTWTIPETPTPAGLTFSAVTGDPVRGAQIFKNPAVAPCMACHTVQGVTAGVIGPNLTHVGSRTTIGAGLYPNDMEHLELWIKDAPMMKPGITMPPMGKGAPIVSGSPAPMAQLTDQQIADIAAYLSSLK